MPQYHDTIPTRDSEFDQWFLNLKNIVVEKTSGPAPAWTHIPADQVTALTGHYDTWHPAFEKMAGPHTKVDTEHKQNERQSSEVFLRPFIGQYLKFGQVSDEERTAMGVHNKDTHPTHHPAPSSQPDTDVRNTKNHFEHEVRALNSSGDAVKPDDAHGVRFAWQVGGERPANGADLPRSAFKRGTTCRMAA